jgi:hypothetical protein
MHIYIYIYIYNSRMTKCNILESDYLEYQTRYYLSKTTSLELRILSEAAATKQYTRYKKK